MTAIITLAIGAICIGAVWLEPTWLKVLGTVFLGLNLLIKATKMVIQEHVADED